MFGFLFNTPRAWNLIGRPKRGRKEENWTEKKLLEANKSKILNLQSKVLHNPPDSSILISCDNDSNILYNQQQLTFKKISPSFWEEGEGWFCFCYSPYITGIGKGMLFFRNTPIVSALPFLKAVWALFKRTGYNRPCQAPAW